MAWMRRVFGDRGRRSRVPEPKVAQKRWHLDVNVGDGLRGGARQAVVREHAKRLTAASGTLVATATASESREERSEREPSSGENGTTSCWIVLTDDEK